MLDLLKEKCIFFGQLASEAWAHGNIVFNDVGCWKNKQYYQRDGA